MARVDRTAVDDHLASRTDANREFFDAAADELARLCHAMAERFARGGRLIAAGSTAAGRSDVRHVAVEFVHPVIVGKRALPALGLTGELPARLGVLARPDDMLIVFGAGEDGGEAAHAVEVARGRGCLTLAFCEAGAEWELVPPGADRDVRQELAETAYHVLWELVHVFVDHRGLLAGRDARPRHDAGASAFLYPFLDERERELEPLLADVRRSVLAKAAEIAERTQTLTENRAVLEAAAADLRASLDGGGTLLALGNGGSATDAMDVVADFEEAWPAIDLAADPAILTAIANDVGVEAVFSRQLIAYGRPGDVLLALSTSGDSRNVVQALAEARTRSLVTIAMVGYDGGRIAGEALADHVVVTRSEHIPRIQEAQASAYHVLRRLVGEPCSVATIRRARMRVEGTVQGVGFRPYVYRLAGDLDLAGHVLNDAHGVVIEVEGPADAVDRFLARLGPEAPSLAAIERVIAEECAPIGDGGFRIVESPLGGVPDAAVTPDAATCPDCLRELFDPGDRRYRYPFVNCTSCGPRFTIVRGVPYDRPLTTMAGFAMCAKCRAEYEDPADRRFHAQPNACPECGPSAALIRPDGGAEPADDAVRAAAAALAAGAIVAVKGLGGYHLACRADDEAVVSALRSRKRREDKPFALMVGSAAEARGLARMGRAEHALLESTARPIVLCPRLKGTAVAGAVAPRSRDLGLMLPYTPIHHLLLADAATPLVMTSGNVSDEPIAYRDDDALERLGAVADLLLVHDRPIHTRTDDSVVRTLARRGGRRTAVLRRSRGYVPAALPLPDAAPAPILACGAELKNTFCLARGGRAWVGHHIGDLENFETYAAFAEGVEHFGRLFAVDPEVVVHDLHPEYLSTKYALDRTDLHPVGVQHHHAHLAAVLAEHGEAGPTVGGIYDGTGYGTDGTIWGGELLVGDLAGFRRVGALRVTVLPGGSQAIRQPWRMACAWLHEAGLLADGGGPPRALAAAVDARTWESVAELARTGLASPATTSMGRLFDAVAALCGVCAVAGYDGQAAIELEALCDPHERGRYPLELDRNGDMLEIDPRPAVAGVVADAAAGVSPGVIARRFHNGVARVTVQACAQAAAGAATETVVLSGGVFQNRRLAEAVAAGLDRRGLRVLMPERLPANDGGISYGQAAVAAHLMAAGITL